MGLFEVRIDDAPAALGGPRQRAVLAVLAIHPNQLVSVDRLVDHIWGSARRRQPCTPCAFSCHVYVQPCQLPVIA